MPQMEPPKSNPDTSNQIIYYFQTYYVFVYFAWVNYINWFF